VEVPQGWACCTSGWVPRGSRGAEDCLDMSGRHESKPRLQAIRSRGGCEPSTAHTFVFADLAGFTALTEAHGDEYAADVAAVFWAKVRRMLPSHRAEEVKTIGDALMIRTSRAADAVRLAVRIVEEIGGCHAFPAVRVGLHTGPAVARGNDWFGATVNLASRVSGRAGAGEVLLTEATRRAASREGLPVIAPLRREVVRFKNVGKPVEVWTVVPRPRDEAGGRLEMDPVCRMAVMRDRAFATLDHAGRHVYFCSAACAEGFHKDPERHLAEAALAA
jgi:adenylate cyclase